MIVGRKKEIELIDEVLEKQTAQFVAVYGRRRVGKTYLINEYFNNMFSFKVTGLRNRTKTGKMKTELVAFHLALKRYGHKKYKTPNNWFEAFEELEDLLENNKNLYVEPVNNKIVLFFDELPWLDTPRSDFKAAFELFWNDYASTKNNIVLFVCGSATSWIINNLFKDTGGFHNRVTQRIHIKPLTLKETEDLLRFNGIDYNRMQIAECNMVFGGIPYYLNMLSRKYSLAQNIDLLCLEQNGQLHNEMEELFSSLFNGYEEHIKVIKILANKKTGMIRNEIIEKGHFESGSRITTILEELEQCSFIRRYDNVAKGKKDVYQLIDSFSMFALNFINNKDVGSWAIFSNSPKHNAWSGNAFEIVCLNNLDAIKSSLRIDAIDSFIYSYYNNNVSGAQIDLVIDRKDEVINICEIKYSRDPFAIDANYEQKLVNKIETFRKETKTKKSLLLTMISFNGVVKNPHANIVFKTIDCSELFV